MKQVIENTGKAFYFAFTLLVLIGLSNVVSAQANHDRARPEKKSHVKPVTKPHETKPVVTRMPERPVSRPHQSKPVVTRPPDTRPPSQRPPVTRPPVHMPRPGNNHRPPGWSANRPPYTRPPHVYRGRKFYTYHPYFHHPYNPYSWGSSWHPVGFFLRTLANAAILISINNNRYRYYNGVFYNPYNNGYIAIAAPLGAQIPILPQGYVTVSLGGFDNYYYGGSFYTRIDNGYQVIAPPPGAVVYNLPPGCISENIGGITYLKYFNTYYLPVQVNGQNAYEVVDVE